MPPQIRVSLRDIGKKLGLSHATISLALRNNPRISAPVRARVQAAAAELGYRPDPMLASLAHYRASKKKTGIRASIAWLNFWPDPRQLYSFGEFRLYWEGANAAAEKFGYRLEEFVCNEEMPLSRLEKILKARGISGILIPPQRNAPALADFNWSDFSAVRFGRSCPAPNVHMVTADQVANTILAFQEILKLGYERIGFITGSGAVGRVLFVAGYLMAQMRVPLPDRLPPLVLEEPGRARASNDWFLDETTVQTVSKWTKKHRPDAIISDVAEARQMLKRAGYEVPKDLGLACESLIDGGAEAGIAQNSEEIGRVAMLLLLSLINDNDRGIPSIFRQVLVAGSWVDGASMPRRQKSKGA